MPWHGQAADSCATATHYCCLVLPQEHLDVLLEHFSELQDGSRQRAVINIDDEAAAAMLEAASGVPCITYGVNNARADVRVESLDLTLWRTTVSRDHAIQQQQHCSTAVRHSQPLQFVWLHSVLSGVCLAVCVGGCA
jgi:UDP-N-acetylmuramate-alanine ligase